MEECYILIYNDFIYVPLINLIPLPYIYYMLNMGVEVGELAVSDSELNVEDDEVGSSEVADRGNARKTRARGSGKPAPVPRNGGGSLKKALILNYN